MTPQRELEVTRTAPDPSYNFIINMGGPGDPMKLLGGFSDMVGPLPDLHRLTGLHKTGDVTLKRGVVDSVSLWAWLEDVRTQGSSAVRNAQIIQRDESRNPVQTWLLRNAIPKKYTAAALSGKSTGDVAVEELVLAAETIEIVPA